MMGSAARRGAGILGCRQGTLAGVGCSRCHNSVSSLHLTPSPRYLSTCTPYSTTQFCKCFQMQMFSEILILSIFADNFFSPHTITKIPIIRPLPRALLLVDTILKMHVFRHSVIFVIKFRRKKTQVEKLKTGFKNNEAATEARPESFCPFLLAI